MKRTALKRKTALRQVSAKKAAEASRRAQERLEAPRAVLIPKELRRAPQRARSFDPRPREKTARRTKGDAFEAEFARARPKVHARSKGYCEGSISGICTGTAQECHHRRLRSQGGGNDLGNLLDLCSACHRFAHSHPKEAARLGLILRSEEATCPTP